MERRITITPRLVEWECPHCKQGTMRVVPNSAVLATFPPIILHQCTHCKYESRNQTNYPYIEYVTESGEVLNGSIA